MSYSRGVGYAPIMPTTAFAQAVDPYATRFSPPNSVYAPYGWGPDFAIGMPLNYSHHIGYERTPIPGTRSVGPMYDMVSPYLGALRYRPSPMGYVGLSDSGDGLSGILAAL